MVMVMPRVAVGGYQHLETVAPQFLRQPDADLMGGFRCDLICPERLIAVIAHPAICFPPQPLGFHELCGCNFLPAVETGHITAALGFHLVGGVFHHAVDGVERRLLPVTGLGGFLWVPGIVDHMVHAAPDGPEGGHGHFRPAP